MPISIYPPILKSSQSAFIYDTTEYPIYFTLQRVTSLSDIKDGHIQIRVVKQSNNRSIVKTSLYPDGIIYKNITSEQVKPTESFGTYSIIIESSDLQEKWQPGYLYKIQLRFGTTPKYTSISDFANWKQEQIENQTFSEWSTVMVIKAISQPTVYIKNVDSSGLDNILNMRVERTRTPLFTGTYQINSISKEAEDVYRFRLYNGNTVNDEYLIEDSGWLQHNSVVDTVDTHRFKTILDNGGYEARYTVTFSIRTINGYEQSSTPYTFLVSENFLSKLTGIEIEVDDSSPYCVENGCMNIYIIAKQPVSGNFVISRSSEKSNFQIYEDLKYLQYNKKQFTDKTLIFQDFTIESGVKYKYAIQQENKASLRTTPLYEENKRYRVVNFEYSYLYHDDVQIKLMFNNKMATFKHTILTNKQDTLGDKYPHLSKNGYAYYAEFPVSGLISLWMDEDQTFFKRGLDGYYYQGELVIPSDKYLENDTDETFNYDLTPNNIFIERKFREKVEEFLNNFDFKLFKSPTEGNIVVVLNNVSLTPNQTLGRMIYEFSATAYEVLENTIENLNEYKIINVGQFKSLATEEVTLSFGQIQGYYDGSKYGYPTELLDEIKKQEEVSIAGGYKTAIKKIRSIKIEQYPQLNFKAELEALKAELAIKINEGEEENWDEINYIRHQIEEYELLKKYLSVTPETRNIIIKINNKEIFIEVGKIYQLNDIDENITSITLKYSGVIILNYVCDLVQKEDEESKVISGIESSKIWGQISGIFTATDNILKQYNFQYQQSKTDRVYNLYKDSSVLYGSYGDIILDNTTINLYKSKNIKDIIKQEVKRQVEIAKGLKDGFPHYDYSTDRWNNGSIYYEFNGIYSLDIESDPGTILYIGKAANGSDKKEIVIGPTGRYILNPMNDLINYIAFKSPQFGIINYKCLTSQLTMSKVARTNGNV